MPSGSESLWVVTPYYNPAGYKRRLDNFKAFRKHLKAPLLVVELAREGRHQIGADDADIVIHLTGEDRIWQKERLINVGLGELPAHVEFVAWADCDLLFEDENWAVAAVRRLESRDGLLQPFETAIYLPRSVDPATVTLTQCKETRPLLMAVSAASAARTSLFDDNEAGLGTSGEGNYDESRYYELLAQYNCYGMAWAARRSQIEACGLFDGGIMGGGDAIKTFAALGKIDAYLRARPFSPKFRAYVEDWMRSATAAGLLRQPDNLPHRVFHLWHGEIANRNYRGRYHNLKPYDFDPRRDLELADNGVWRWTNPDGEIARVVSEYFFSRKEDGAL